MREGGPVRGVVSTGAGRGRHPWSRVASGDGRKKAWSARRAARDALHQLT